MGNSMLRKYELDEKELDMYDEFEVVCGRDYEKKLLRAAIFNNDYNELLLINDFSMFLVTAPQGYGKSYLAKCYARELTSNGYRVHEIDCEEIMEDENSDTLLKRLFDEVIERTDPDGESEEKIYLCLKNFRMVSEEKKYEKIVLEAFKKIDALNCKCIILATDEDVTSISKNILTVMDIIELGLPDQSERREFFASYLGVDVENPLNDEEIETIYPINISAQETEHDERDNLAQYCAEHTEGLSFGQLKKVNQILEKILKSKLVEMTNGMSDDALWSQISMGKNYCIDEEAFDEIVSKVRRVGALMSHKENCFGDNPVNNVSQPQIIYAMPPGIQGGMVGYGDMIQGNGNFVTQQKAREKMLENATGENPDVNTLNAAYAMAEEMMDSILE